MILGSFPEYEHSHLDSEHRGQKGGYIKTDTNHLLNTLFHEWHLLLSEVEPCLQLDSYCLPLHNDLLLVSEVIEVAGPGRGHDRCGR